MSYKKNDEYIESLKNHIVKVEEIDEKGKIIKIGTGFFIDCKHIITAAHVVSESLDSECTVRITYLINGVRGSLNAKALYEAPTCDLNVLEILGQVEFGTHYEFSKIVENSFRKREFEYCAYGYPATKPEGHYQQGQILDENKDYNDNSIIDVTLGEGRLNDYRGYSGSPVICNGQLIGIAIEQSVGLNAAQSIKVLDLSSANSYLVKDWLGSDDFIEEIVSNYQKESSEEIKRNKLNGKYIPEIFVELGKMKEYLRGFSDPVLFFKKHLDYVKRHSFKQYNMLLQSYGLANIQTIEGEYEISLVNVQRISDEMVAKLNDMLTYVTKLTRSEDIRECVPEEYLELFDLTFYQHRLLGLEWELKDRIDLFKSLQATQILLTEKAGQGKTNLLCDFTENVLLRKGIPCFFAGMRYLIDDDISKTLLNYSGYDFSSVEEIFEVLEFYSRNVQKPFVIVLDAINEQRDVQNSKQKLYSFLNKASSFNNVKVILTARTEYFEEKFGDMKDICPQVNQFVSYNFNSHHPKLGKRVFDGYMEHFKMEIHDIGDSIYEQLSKDFLLLRMFSEAYHGSEDSPTIIPALFHLFRYEIFEKYYNFKKENLKEWDRQQGVFDGGSTYDCLINTITEYMIRQKQFSNIERSLIVEQVQNDLLVKLVNEDIIFRDDIKKIKGLIEQSVEVINFTFDEFRDYCLAKKLMENFDESNPDASAAIISDLTQNGLEVSEGVQKYLFFASKKIQSEPFSNVIKEQKWFFHIFLNNIFSVSEEFIVEKDIEIIRRLLTNMKFYEEHFTRVVKIYESLIKRYNIHVYSKLNIKFLITIFNEIEDADFRRYVRNVFRSSYEDRYSIYGRQDDRIPIDILIHKLKQYMRRSFNEDIIFFLCYLNFRGVFIDDFFDWCIEEYPDQSIDLFEKSDDIRDDCIRQAVIYTVRDLSFYDFKFTPEMRARWERMAEHFKEKNKRDLNSETDRNPYKTLEELLERLGIKEDNK